MAARRGEALSWTALQNLVRFRKPDFVKGTRFALDPTCPSVLPPLTLNLWGRQARQTPTPIFAPLAPQKTRSELHFTGTTMRGVRIAKRLPRPCPFPSNGASHFLCPQKKFERASLYFHLQLPSSWADLALAGREEDSLPHQESQHVLLWQKRELVHQDMPFR